VDHPVPVAFASAAGQLRHLTYLSAHNLTPAGARLLPVTLRRLTLYSPYKDSSGSTDPCSAAAASDLISISHLTALSSLDWTNYDGELCDVTLPQQPIKLAATGRVHLVGPHNLPSESVSARGAEGHGLEVKEEGCYTGRSRSYAATEPSHGRIQPVREGEPSGQTPPLKGCIARSACSQSLMGWRCCCSWLQAITRVI
jgi:hypothetical protein